MFRTLPTRWILALVCGALATVGCSTTSDTPQSETGGLALDLVIADGVEIDLVNWQITGNGMDMSGEIDVSAPGSTASVEVFGLPPGAENYLVSLTAESVDEQVGCKGSAEFNVEVGETTEVMVVLNCKLPRRFGSVRVNGEFNICAELIKAVVSPLQTSVGNDIDLFAQGLDQEGDPIAYSWTGSGGSIADPSAASTTYTCQEVGAQEVSISVTDNDEYCDMATWTIPVTCVEGDGGTGGTGGDAGAGGTGGAGGEAGAGGTGGQAGAGGQGGGAGGMGGQGGGGGMVDPCDGVDCSDGNECTSDLCTDGNCSNPPVTDGTACDNNMGTCDMGMCMPDDACEGVDCSDGNDCTADVCTDGNCSNPNLDANTMCNQDGGSVCDGAGNCVECNSADQCPDDANECTAASCSGAACGQENVPDDTPCADDTGTCQSGTCEVSAAGVVCEQYNPGPAETGQTCDGSAGQECLCEKAEFIAVDCELVGNSAPLPLQASAQQFGVAFAGDPIDILPQDAIVIPATLVCGFIGAGFESALVDDSGIEITYSNANITSSQLSSFLDPDGLSEPPFTSPHGQVLFDFGVACGDNCTGALGSETCESSGNPCSLNTFTDDCSVENGGAVGTGPGIEAPFFANAPGSIPPGPIPAQLVNLTPSAAGSVNINTPYSGIALQLPDVGGLVSGCVGGACTNAKVCSPVLRGTEVSPRVMYDANCNKLEFAACGGTECATDADCPYNNAAIGGAFPGQTCDTSAGTPGVCTNVNSGTCGLGGAGLCPDSTTSCGSCEDADGNTGICTLSGFTCAIDIDCPFGANDLCGPPTACAVNGDCASGETCVLSDDRCDDVIEGTVPTCCGPFEDFTSTADVCKGSLPAEDAANAPACCDQKLPTSPGFTDVFCSSATNVASCCAAIATDYPSTTPAQLPQLWVNP